MHPYIGLHGTVRAYPYTGGNAGTNDYTGTLVAIGQGGSVNDSDGAYVVAIILRDTPHPVRGDYHEDCALSFFNPDDVAEARRRLTAEAAKERS